MLMVTQERLDWWIETQDALLTAVAAQDLDPTLARCWLKHMSSSVWIHALTRTALWGFEHVIGVQVCFLDLGIEKWRLDLWSIELITAAVVSIITNLDCESVIGMAPSWTPTALLAQMVSGCVANSFNHNSLVSTMKMFSLQAICAHHEQSIYHVTMDFTNQKQTQRKNTIGLSRPRQFGNQYMFCGCVCHQRLRWQIICICKLEWKRSYMLLTIICSAKSCTLCLQCFHCVCFANWFSMQIVT